MKRRGDILRAAEVGLLATVGQTVVKVYQAPRISILSTGDELVPPSENPKPGQIRDSNGIMLKSLLQELSGGVWDAKCLGIAPDSMSDLENMMIRALKDSDVLITSGAVSMGEMDLVKPLLEKLGTIHFGRVLIKPGKPMTFATVPMDGMQKLVFATPGNPVSSIVTSILFAVPALKKLAGHRSYFLPEIQVKLAHSVRLDKYRPEFYRATLQWDFSKGSYVATGTGRQISSRLLSMRSANALLKLPQGDQTLQEGDIVSAILLSTWC